MALQFNSVEKIKDNNIDNENQVNKKEKINLNVFNIGLSQVDDVLKEMLEIALKAKNEKNYIPSNFSFQNYKKKIDVIANNTNVNEAKLLLGDVELVVDKMKDSPLTLLKPEFGIQNILIDEIDVEKMVRISYIPKADVIIAQNKSNGHQESETLQGRTLNHKAFNNVGIGIVFNDNFEKFKTEFIEKTNVENKCYSFNEEDSLLNASNVEILDVHGYVGDLQGLNVEVKISGNLYENSYLIMKAESGDFTAKFNIAKLTENKYAEITLQREVAIENDKIRSDSICIGFKVEVNTFKHEFIATKNISKVLFKLNELRYTLFFYRDRLPYMLNLSSKKDNDKILQVPLYPVTVDNINLQQENLYTDENINGAIWKVLNAINFINSEKHKVEKILELENNF